MKNMLTLMICALLTGSALGQSSATQVKYNKVAQPALQLTLPYGESVAEGTILKKLRETGYDPESKGSLFWKSNKQDGYYVFKGVQLEGAQQPMDLYFKVDSRRKNQSTIYLLADKGNGNFTSSVSDEAGYYATQRFLNNFVEETAAFKLDKDIKGQEEAVTEAEKKLTRLKDNEREIERKLESLQKDLRDNRDEQEKQTRTIEDERRKLYELRGRKQM